MKFDFSDLIDQKLVIKKDYGDLAVYKYHRRVFFKAMWNTDARLLDARGMVLDQTGNPVVWPFTKIFNRLENGTDCDRERPVIAVRKVNGFMAAASKHNDKTVVSTTGTLDSDFAVLARDILEQHGDFTCRYVTHIFEIADPSDPHIVDEQAGAWLIGCRDNYTGKLWTEQELDMEAALWGFLRPEWHAVRFSDAVAMADECEHEGYVIRSDDTNQDMLMKIKSPHYLAKKFLMRMSKNNVERMFTDALAIKQMVDEEFYPIIDAITSDFSLYMWQMLDADQRRAYIEKLQSEVLTC